VPLAEAAFEYVVPVREDSFRFDTPSFGWHCRSCGGLVSDRGPYESYPEDNELAAATMTGRDGHRSPGFPVERLPALLGG
jgi:hypothetical protein